MGKKLGAIIKYLKECLLSIIYPELLVCLSCGKVLEEAGLCKKCREKIVKIKDIIYINNIEIYSCAYYSYTIKKLVFNLKYKADFNSGKYLVDLIEEKIGESKFDYITYVPSSKEKLKERGFNQCEFLAKELSSRLNIPYINSLIKSKGIREQKSLSRYEREENIKDAFKLKDNSILIGKSILLLDDILTTGATIRACLNELQQVKDISIKVITVGTNNI